MYSRYDLTHPLTVTDPINRELIIGEIEFYKVDSIEGVLKGEFLGTDFNYAYCKEFRKLVEINSIDKKMLLLEGQQPEEQMNEDFQQFASNIIDNRGILLWQIAQNRNKNMCLLGVLTCFYAVALISTFVQGIVGLIRMHNDVTDMPNFNIFNYALPFIALVTDYLIKKTTLTAEKHCFIVMKLFFMIYYLGIYVLAFQKDSTSIYFIIAHSNFIVYPIISLLYTILLKRRYLVGFRINAFR